MTIIQTYTTNQIDKLGNAIIFLCERLQGHTQVSKTHILKLVFILEEFSIRKTGIPFFGLKFEVWKLGPVSPDLYLELTEKPNLLAAFIKVEYPNETSKVAPLKSFSDEEFSDMEMELLNEVADRFKYCNAKELVHFTHRKNSPWYLTAQKNGLLDILEAGKINTTDIEVDFTEIIGSDTLKLSLFNAHREFLNQNRRLKN